MQPTREQGQTNSAEQTVAVANHSVHLEPALAHEPCRILVCCRDFCGRCLRSSSSSSSSSSSGSCRVHRLRRVLGMRVVSASHSLNSPTPFAFRFSDSGCCFVCMQLAVAKTVATRGRERRGGCHQAAWRRSTVPTTGSRRAVGVAASQQSSMRRYVPSRKTM